MAHFEGYERREAKILAALKEYGPCPAHRPSFLKKILGEG